MSQIRADRIRHDSIKRGLPAACHAMTARRFFKDFHMMPIDYANRNKLRRTRKRKRIPRVVILLGVMALAAFAIYKHHHRLVPIQVTSKTHKPIQTAKEGHKRQYDFYTILPKSSNDILNSSAMVGSAAAILINGMNKSAGPNTP